MRDECRRAGCVRAARGAAGDDRSCGAGDRRVVFLPVRVRAFGGRLREGLMRFGMRAVAVAAAVAGRIGMARGDELVVSDTAAAAGVGRGGGERAVGRQDHNRRECVRTVLRQIAGFGALVVRGEAAAAGGIAPARAAVLNKGAGPDIRPVGHAGAGGRCAARGRPRAVGERVNRGKRVAGIVVAALLLGFIGLSE